MAHKSKLSLLVLSGFHSQNNTKLLASRKKLIRVKVESQMVDKLECLWFHSESNKSSLAIN